MITNERQYRIAKAQVEKFGEAMMEIVASIAYKTDTDVDDDSRISTAQLRGLTSQFEELQEEVARYEELRSTREITFEAAGLMEIGVRLIEARIASGLTQKGLAELLGLKPQQIQRYEEDRYRTASLPRLAEVAAALGLSISTRLELKRPSDATTRMRSAGRGIG